MYLVQIPIPHYSVNHVKVRFKFNCPIHLNGSSVIHRCATYTGGRKTTARLKAIIAEKVNHTVVPFDNLQYQYVVWW